MTHKDLVEELLSYASMKAAIAELVAKHGNAPRYMHEQAAEHVQNAQAIAGQLDVLMRLVK